MPTPLTCRINRHFNQFDYDQTGIRTWQLSAYHIFPEKTPRCLCGQRFWSPK